MSTKTKASETDKAVKEEVKEIAEALQIDLSSDQEVQIGDWKGKAKDFRTHFIPQSELAKMRERDKQELRQHLETIKTQMALQHQQEVHRRMAPQQNTNGSGLNARLAALYDKVRNDPNRMGFMHVDQFEEVVNMLTGAVSAELQARDRVLGQVGQGLDQWYRDYAHRANVVDSLAGNHADTAWTRYIDSLEEAYPEVPRSTLEMMASAYEAEQGESPEQLQEAIKEMIGSEVKQLSSHRAARQKHEFEQQDQIAEAGIPGQGGQARPSGDQPPLRTAGEIADKFWPEDDAPA